MALFPLVNGKAYDYSNIEMPLPFVGLVKAITEINYSDTIDKGQLRGLAPHNLAWTDGQYDAEGSFIVEKQFHTAFIQAACAAAPGGDIRKYEFSIPVIYGNFGMPLITDKLVGCVIMGNEQGNSQGTDAIVVSVSLGIKAVFWGGVNPLGASALDLGVSAI